MKFDLKKPCKHCPFGDTKTRITFACKERAEEIAETAYRQGFVCHEHSLDTSDDDEENGGFTFNPDGSSQHCAGALLMYLKDTGDGNVPFQYLSEEEQDRIQKRLDWNAPVFESEEDFLEANE